MKTNLDLSRVDIIVLIILVILIVIGIKIVVGFFKIKRGIKDNDCQYNNPSNSCIDNNTHNKKNDQR